MRDRKLQLVLAASPPELHDCLDQLLVAGALAQAAAAPPQRLPVQRVGGVRPRGAAAVLLHPQQPLGLQRLDGPHRRQARKQVDAQRIPVGQQLQHVQLVLVQALQARPDQVHEARCHGPRPLPPPHAVDVGQHTLITPGDDQLAQQQRVAARRPPQPRRGRRVDLPPERRDQHVLDLQRRQRQQVEPLDGPLLPQGGDRVGRRLPAPEREQHERRAALDNLVQQRRRDVIEQLGVVHAEQQALLPADRDQRLSGPPRSAASPSPTSTPATTTYGCAWAASPSSFPNRSPRSSSASASSPPAAAMPPSATRGPPRGCYPAGSPAGRSAPTGSPNGSANSGSAPLGPARPRCSSSPPTCPPLSSRACSASTSPSPLPGSAPAAATGPPTPPTSAAAGPSHEDRHSVKMQGYYGGSQTVWLGRLLTRGNAKTASLRLITAVIRGKLKARQQRRPLFWIGELWDGAPDPKSGCALGQLSMAIEFSPGTVARSSR